MAMVGRDDEARADMEEARAGFADLRLDLRPRTSRYSSRSRRRWRAIPWRPRAPSATPRRWSPAPGDRWYQAMVNVDLALTVIAQDRPDARRRGGRADRGGAGALRPQVGDQAAHRAGVARRPARRPAGGRDGGVAVAETTPLLLVRADAQRALAARTARRRPHRRRGRRRPPRARARRAQGQPRRRRRRRERLLAKLGG